MAKHALAVTPHDFNKIGSLQAFKETPWAKIPTYYYDVTQHQFPLTPAEFDANFNGEIRLFSLEDSVPGHQTNAAVGSSVNEPFIATGVGVVAIGENKSFTLPGQLVDSPVTDCPPIGPCADGQNAALYWGGSTWQFIANFFQAYRLNVLINRRFLVVDESLFDVGMVPVPPEFVGASSSLVPGMPYVREVNDVMSAKGILKTFLPQNVAGGSLCVGAPTAGVTYGHPRIIGLSNRIFNFSYPLLFLPGMSWDAKFTPVENDVAFLPAMRRNSVLDASAGIPVPASGMSAPCGAWTVDGGTVSIGLVFKGCALQPAACVQFLTDFVPAGSGYESMFIGNPYISSLMSNPILRANLAGVPEDANLRRYLGNPKG